MGAALVAEELHKLTSGHLGELVNTALHYSSEVK
jgi:hypothetical protein